MSGGHFDYKQYAILEIIEGVKAALTERDISEAARVKFNNAIDHLNTAQIYAQRIDWFLSGDDSEDSFHKRLREDLAMTTPLEKSHRELYEALRGIIAHRERTYESNLDKALVGVSTHTQGWEAIKNAEKIIKGER